MSEFQGLWLVASVDADGTLEESAEEALTPARELAEASSQPLTAVLLAGNLVSADAENELGKLGVSRIIAVRDPALLAGSAPSAFGFNTQVASAALSDLIARHKPAIVLFAASAVSNELAPRVSAVAGGSLITQAFSLKLADASAVQAHGLPALTVIAGRSSYAESLLNEVVGTLQPQLVTLKPKAFPKAVSSQIVTPSVETVEGPSRTASTLTLKKVSPTESKGAKKLEEADIVVSGGRGLKEAANFQLVEDLAATLGAAVGASRAVVDAGWRPHSEQVGQTGKTVSPHVYFALGISGALQHLVGMNSSQIIIAINRDENAPIFKLADFGIVGDVLTIAPELTQAIRARQLSPSR